MFRKRSSESAFRVAALCQYLYQLEAEENKIDHKWSMRSGVALFPEVIQKRVRQIYLFMAEYILQAMLDRWGKRFEDLNTKREAEQKAGPKENLFDCLTDTFTREQLNLLIEKQGKVTPDKVFLNRWKKLRVIEIIDKNTFRKIKK